METMILYVNNAWYSTVNANGRVKETEATLGRSRACQKGKGFMGNAKCKVQTVDRSLALSSPLPYQQQLRLGW